MNELIGFMITFSIVLFGFVILHRSLVDDRSFFIKENKKVKWSKTRSFWNRKIRINLLLILVPLLILFSMLLFFRLFKPSIFSVSLFFSFLGFLFGFVLLSPIFLASVGFILAYKKKEKIGYCKVYRMEKYLDRFNRADFDLMDKDLHDHFRGIGIAYQMMDKDRSTYYPMKMNVRFPDHNVFLNITKINNYLSKNFRLLIVKDKKEMDMDPKPIMKALNEKLP